MTEKYRFFDSTADDQRQYTSADYSEVQKRFLRDGYIPNVDNELFVSPVELLTLQVDTGEAMIQGRWYKNNSIKELTLQTANSTYDRIDRVVLRLDQSTSERKITAEIKTGIAESNPSPPSLKRNNTIYELSLAQIYIAAGAGTINFEDITDERKNETLCGRAITSIVKDEMINFNKDAFQDFVKNAKANGGVEFIPCDDGRVTLPDNQFESGDYKGINIDGTVIIDFTGTALHLLTDFQDTSRTVDVSIDSGTVSTITIENTTIDTDNAVIKLASGLSSGEHNAEITANDTFYLKGFLAEQTSDRTVDNDGGISYINSERQEITAGTQSFTTPTTARADLLTVDKEGNTQVVEGTDGNEVKAFRVEAEPEFGISREYQDDIPKFIKEGWNKWNSGITGDETTGWEIKTVNEHSNNRYIITKTADVELFIEFIGIGLDLILQKSSNGGEYAVSVDGGSETIYDSYDSEGLKKQQRESLVNNLDFGYHEVRIRNTGTKNTESTDYFTTFDAFDIYIPELPVLSSDNQKLADVYPMPSPATMASIPARPTSAEEKGWVRKRVDEGCRFIGSGWSISEVNYDGSLGLSAYTETQGDYAEKSFIGNGIRLLAYCTTGYSDSIDIYIDGGFKENVSSRFDGEGQLLFEDTSLNFGFHTIKVENRDSGSGMRILAFEVHRPLYLEDTRNLTPIKENDVYDIEYNSKLDKNLPSNVGDQLDRLEQMENVVKVENENGTAYLYPDGRAVCINNNIATIVSDLEDELASGYDRFEVWEWIFPINFSIVYHTDSSIEDSTDLRSWSTSEHRNNSLVGRAFGISSELTISGIAIGRWE